MPFYSEGHTEWQTLPQKSYIPALLPQTDGPFSRTRNGLLHQLPPDLYLLHFLQQE